MDNISLQIEDSRVKYGLTQEECSKFMGVNSKTYRARLEKDGAFTYQEVTSYVAHLFCIDKIKLMEFNILWSTYESFGVIDLPWVKDIFISYDKESEFELSHQIFSEMDTYSGEEFKKKFLEKVESNPSSISQIELSLLSNFKLLDRVDQKRIYEEIKKLASEKLDLSHLDEE